MNQRAKEDHLFVCLACGKTSKDRYGFEKISQSWDESCMLNSGEFPIELLEYERGLVVKIRDKKDTNSDC